MMDWLYRIFYIVFAMEVAAVVLFPLLLLFRVLAHNLPKKNMLHLWRLYFFRIICPIAISSPFSIVSGWNRWFHRFMSSLGLTMETQGGLLRSWSSVLHGSITTTWSYRVCAWIWLVGVLFVLGIMFIRQRQIVKGIRSGATHLTDRLYQSKTNVSVMTGLFRLRFYVPEEIDAKQAKYTVAHMQSHEKRKSALWRLAGFLVAAVHWFNPLVWWALYMANRDEEMACDEETVRKLGAKEKNAYTQSILNMAKEDVAVPYTVSVIYELALEQRAQRILHWREPAVRQRLTGLLLFTLLFFHSFLLRPLQMAWGGGTWGQGQSVQEPVKQSKGNSDILAQTAALSPSGLERTLKLVLQSGVQSADEARGRCSLVLEDSVGNKIDEISLRDIFRKQEMDLPQFVFPKGLALRLGDYNNDQIQEVIIGQQMTWSDDQRETVNAVLSAGGNDASVQKDGQDADGKTQGKTDAVKEYVYLVLQIEETALKVVSEPVYSQQMSGMETLTPGELTDIKDIFYTSTEKGRIYYVWNYDEQKYMAQKLSEEQLNQHREASLGKEAAGVKKAFYLKDDKEKEQMRVDTQSDTTGSREIKTVIMSKGDRKMKAVKGYYCDLKWAVQADGSTGRYAILTYNGTKAQTFVLYDVEERKELYRHEDGNALLSQVFGQYNDSQIRFKSGSAVVYTLLEQKGNVLTISFAAQAEEGVTVRGTYEYDMEQKTASHLQFSQNGDAAQEGTQEGSASEPKASPTPLPTINSNLWDYL